MTTKAWWTLGALAISTMITSGACANGGMVSPAPEPPGGDEGAPEPPSRATKSALGLYKGVPGANVKWLAWPKRKTKTDPSWGPVLTDIEEHIHPKHGSTYYDADKITHGHETTHGINSDVRNENWSSGKKLNGFYLTEDRGVLVDEPNIRKSKVAEFVPASLRGSRYSLYITGQVEWDDTPTYVMDEWIAYVNGGAVGVDLVNRGLWKYSWRDGVNGQLEFTVYGIALAMAVEKYDPAYFASNEQFKELIAWVTKRAMDIYRQGMVMDAFKWDKQDAYYKGMKTNPDAEAWRAFARKLFGTSWANEVLFGDPPEPGGEDAGVADSGGGGGVDSGGGGVVDSGGGGGTTDTDGDGIPDSKDLCSGTPAGANVWTYGEWIGCAAGQRRDSLDFGGTDTDGDRISDVKDLCSGTAAGARVWTYGEWIGCAAGQFRDK